MVSGRRSPRLQARGARRDGVLLDTLRAAGRIMYATAGRMHDSQSMHRADDLESSASNAESNADLESNMSTVQRVSEYPCCILWTPIHPITWFAPFVGHMGITDSLGRLHDWGGGSIEPCKPQRMMFGEPTRYIRYHPKEESAWDEALAAADREYDEYIHCMLCGLDCHSHVARCLNIMRANGCALHNKVELAARIFFCGRHVSVVGAISTWLGFTIFAMVWVVVRSH